MNEEFEALVLAVISEIPCGQVASYGQIAELAGYPRHGRHVRILNSMAIIRATVWSTARAAQRRGGMNNDLCWKRKAWNSSPTAAWIWQNINGSSGKGGEGRK